MKKLLPLAAFIALGTLSIAQTAGTLAFSFTEATQASTYQSTGKHVIAVWIQTSAGGFVKTKLRRAGGGTADHLPTWAVNAGGTSGNCLATSCNVVSASTGASLSSFGARSITWDGTDASGNLVADGTYRVAIQETWNHGTTGTATRYINFTKGAAADVQTPASDANFTGISLSWTPSAAGIEENPSTEKPVKIYPNPSSNGVFNVEFSQAEKMKVVNVLGVTIYEEKISPNETKKTVDLSKFSNGVYFICLTEGNDTNEHRVIVNKQ